MPFKTKRLEDFSKQILDQATLKVQPQVQSLASRIRQITLRKKPLRKRF